MISIGVHITTKSPLLLAANPVAYNLMESLDFIPGNSIRGALARRYIEKGGKAEDPAFKRLFLNSEVRYGCGRINGAHIIPLSARTCKYDGGFKVDNGHGVIDLLIGGEGAMSCPNVQCRKSIDYIKGYMNPILGNQETVHKRLITRTTIDAKRNQASQGQLYSQRVVEEDQVFHAVIEVPEELEKDLESLLSMTSVTALGTGRSRGQGWVIMQKGQFTFPAWGTAKERFTAYQNINGKPLLAVTLLSDTILTDKYLRDCTAPDISHLQHLGIKPDEWEEKPCRSFAANRKVYGFDGLPLQLPRMTRLAIEAGSTFLFRKIDSARLSIPDGDGTGWIGEKNDEGFGQVLLWHPFHVQPEKEVMP